MIVHFSDIHTFINIDMVAELDRYVISKKMQLALQLLQDKVKVAESNAGGSCT